MPVCKNVKSKTFTGKENTPLGKGYHASGEKIGSVMKGKDKKNYKVVKTKTGKRWQKVELKRTSRGVHNWDYVDNPILKRQLNELSEYDEKKVLELMDKGLTEGKAFATVKLGNYIKALTLFEAGLDEEKVYRGSRLEDHNFGKLISYLENNKSFEEAYALAVEGAYVIPENDSRNIGRREKLDELLRTHTKKRRSPEGAQMSRKAEYPKEYGVYDENDPREKERIREVNLRALREHMARLQEAAEINSKPKKRGTS